MEIFRSVNENTDNKGNYYLSFRKDGKDFKFTYKNEDGSIHLLI